MHELDRAYVQAAGRLADDHQFDVPAHLPGDHDLLLVAAGQRPGRRRDGGGPHVVLLDALDRRFPDRVQVQREAGGVRRLVVDVEDEVVGDREVSHQAVLRPVLRDISDARVQPGPGRGVAEVGAVQRAPSRSTGRRPISASHSSVWPLPWTPATPRISPARTWKDTSRTDFSPRSPRHAQALTSSTTRRAAPAVLLTRSWTDRPTISDASSVVAGGRRPLADDLAAADDRDACRRSPGPL